MTEELQLRIQGGASLPTLIYLPGLHGDWTLIGGFRHALGAQARFVEVTYPRTLTWSLDDYAAAIETALEQNGVTRGWLLGESYGSQVLWAMVGRASSRAGVESAACPDIRCRGECADSSSHPPSRRAIAPLRRDGGRLDTTTILNGSSGASPRQAAKRNFQIEGVILAGGFVKHPLRWAARLAERLTGRVSNAWFVRFIFGYAKIARFRYRRSPETLAKIDEFIARRTALDRRAAQHRLHLVAENDPRPAARQTKLPVFGLSGLLDPIVPWPFVRRWLRKNCPALRDYKIIARADHNVLSTAPREAAKQVLAWMNG
jgi:pimeloyl-ACP methyl ester carboxylesterase